MMEIKKLEKELASLRERLLNHELYQNINSIDNIQVFMETHVFAVWDFMSLLKALQNELTNTSVPWTPKGNPISRRLINEIVLGEESDVNELDEPMSHFEMYLDAMKQVGANTSDIEKFIKQITIEKNYRDAQKRVNISGKTKEFNDFTFRIIDTHRVHLIASVFTFGREDLIPDMFVEIVKKLNRGSNKNFNKLIYYLERHIELDSDKHGPMALKMIQELCGDDNKKWTESIEVSKEALIKRIELWDSINDSIVNKRETTCC